MLWIEDSYIRSTLCFSSNLFWFISVSLCLCGSTLSRFFVRLDHRHEALEQVVAVAWAGPGLGQTYLAGIDPLP